MARRTPRRYGERERSACLSLDLFGLEPTPEEEQSEVPESSPERDVDPEEIQDTGSADEPRWGPSAAEREAADAAVGRARIEAEAALALLPPPPDEGSLSAEAAAAIREAAIEGTRVRLRSALSREVYLEVAEAFQRIGGRWVSAGRRQGDKPSGYHSFPVESVGLVTALAETGKLPPRNPTSFFPSPAAVVDVIMEAADVGAAEWCGYRFLEPHGGQGAIADRIRSTCPGCPLDVVEILDLNRRVLRRKGYDPIAADFLHFNPGPIYDRILANPPFRLPGSPRAYQDHIRHAWDLLRDGGILVAIAPAGVTHDQKRDREFLRWLADRGTMEELPDRSFEESGTGVSTALLRLEKRDVGWKRRPFMGWVSWNAWQTALWAENDWELYQDERRIHARITRGEFGRDPVASANWALGAAVRSLYESAAADLNRRPLYSGVYLTDSDHDALLTHFLDRFREHVPDHPAATLKTAA